MSDFREPPPRSVERIGFEQIDFCGFKNPEDDFVTIQATFTYETWDSGRQNGYEVVDAISALYWGVDGAIRRAQNKRERQLQAEFDVLKEEEV